MPPPTSQQSEYQPTLAVQGLFWILIFCWTISPLAGYDYWFYLASGRSVLEEGTIPWADSYLGTTAIYGFERYADSAWLGNTVFYLVYALGGVLGLTLFKSALLTATTYLTYLNCRLLGLHCGWAMLWSALALWTIRGRFELRTYLYTDFFLAVLLFCLLKHSEHRDLKRLVIQVVPLMVLWTNIHQGVVAGCYLLVAWWLLGGVPRLRGGLVIALAGVAIFVKPYGIYFLDFLRDTFGNTLAVQGVMEWGNPSWSILLTQLSPLLLSLAILIPWGVLQRKKKQQPLPPLLYLGVALFFLFLGLRSIRAISEWLPIVAPLAAAYFPSGQGSCRSRRTATLTLAALFLLTFRPFSWHQLTSVDNRYPTALLQALPRDGQVFNSFEHGNFLVFKGVPPFIHGMTALYREELLQDYIDVLNAGPKTSQILERFSVEAMILHFPSSLDATGNLLEFLTRSPEWQLKAFDDQGLVYLRDLQKGSLTALRPWNLEQPWTSPELAEAQLDQLVREWPSARAYVLLSRLAAERDDWTAAKRAAERAVQLRPDLYQPWYQYGLISAKTGHLAGLLEATRNTVRLAPNDATAHLHRGLALEALRETRRGFARWWTTQRAWYHLRRALIHDPSLEPAELHLRAL